MVPIRSCIACKKKNEKSELLRIVKGTKGCAELDENQKINGRAIYICKSKICMDNLIKMLKKNKIKIKVDIESHELIELLENLKQKGWEE